MKGVCFQPKSRKKLSLHHLCRFVVPNPSVVKYWRKSFNISSLSDFDRIPTQVTNLQIDDGVEKNGELDLTSFLFLKEVNIGSNALTGLTTLLATNLPFLEQIGINNGSLLSIEK